MDLPLTNHPLVRAQGLEEANNAFNRLYCFATLELPDGTDTITWHANGISIGPMCVIAGCIDRGVRISPETRAESVVIIRARRGRGTLQCRRKEYGIAGRLGVVISAEGANMISLHPGFSCLTVGLNSATLNETLHALSGIYSATPLEFDCVFDAGTRHDAELLRLLDFIIQTIDQDRSPLAHSLALNNLQNAFLMGFLLGHPHNHRKLLEKGVATPSTRTVQTVEAYLDANADKPITMTELHALTGMSVRAIQAGFRAKRGCSPMEFLRERRLLMAKRRLETALLGTQVTEVAFSCGFGHLGRFSRDYRKRFGENPSETLERALKKIGPYVGNSMTDTIIGSQL